MSGDKLANLADIWSREDKMRVRSPELAEALDAIDDSPLHDMTGHEEGDRP